MQWRDSKDRFGAVSIGLHWLNALVVIALLVLGFIAWPLPRGVERSGLLHWHMSLALLLLPFAIARVVWRVRHGKPATEQRNRLLKTAADIVWKVMLIAIVLQMLTGSLLVWMHDRPLEIFGLVTIPSPLPPMDELQAALVQQVHLVSAVALASTIVIHILGALKHLLIDRDGVTQRMLKFRRKP